jgi:flavin reductase (DIM6/NTAB) family NADH-FMN oxidoreductase RutF
MPSIEVEKLSVRERYHLLVSTVIPRPIAWVSSLNHAGQTNLAPFSFFNAIAANPMSVCFAPVNDRNGKPKDTLLNIKETGQFVVNIVTEDNAEKMNATSETYPYGVSEFEKVGLTPAPSLKVKAPRVKESPVQMECELLQIVTLSEGPLGGNLIIGKVVVFHADDKIWNNGDIKHQDLKAVGRMAGNWYARTRDAFELIRPK